MIFIDYNFSGDLQLLSFILDKHKNYLYDGSVKKFIESNKWNNASQLKYSWQINGVPPRVWNILHKDLIILRLKGLLNFKDSNLKDLKEGFQTS
tara:strand:- start:43 stop:324 length:282 start_codon:yes stop_codon:yes gene_type:complete